MKQTIEIEIPEGKKAVWKDNKVVFEDIMPKMPKTWEEFLCVSLDDNTAKKNHINFCKGVTLRVSSNISEFFNSSYTPSPTKTTTIVEAHLALMQLHQLRDYYRQGWTPKDDEGAFGIIKRKDGTYKVECCYKCSVFLLFNTSEKAQEFLNNFEDLIKKAGDLI